MSNNHETEEKELLAIRLIDQAETLADKGKGDKAIDLYEQAAQIYLDIGSYIKLDEIYIRIAKKISQFKNTLQAIYRLKSIIFKTEQLQIEEISAKLLIQLGNVSFKIADWETAGESWEKASEYLNKADPEEFSGLSSFMLLKAGQAYERSPIKKTEGKRLILKAIMRINKFDELYEKEEQRAVQLIVMKEYEAAGNKYLEISKLFKDALENLPELIDEEESKDTMINARARFTHFIAEYQTVAALCLRAAKDRAFNDRIKELGHDSIELFQKAIKLQKEYLFEKKSDFDKEIVYRITFDSMLLAIVQEMLGEKVLDSLEFLLEGAEKHKKLIKSLKNTPYYKITEQIQEIGVRESLDKILKTNMGHFEQVKNTLISYFQ